MKGGPEGRNRFDDVGRVIRKASERALSVDVIDAFDDTLECLIAALLQQTPVISARCSAEVGRIAEGSSALIRGAAMKILCNVRSKATTDPRMAAPDPAPGQ